MNTIQDQPAVPPIVMMATNVQGKVTATYLENGEPRKLTIENGTEIPAAAEVLLSSASSFDVVLVQRCLRAARPDIEVQVTSDFPQCLHFNKNCCDKAQKYEVFTPGGTLGINFARMG